MSQICLVVELDIPKFAAKFNLLNYNVAILQACYSLGAECLLHRRDFVH